MRLRTFLLAIAALPLSLLAWRDTAVAYWLSADPVQAPWPIRSDPCIELAAADEVILDEREAGEQFWRTIPAQARTALRANPLEVTAVRDLALVADILGASGGTPDATHYLRLAERMSRRDVPTQIALLRQAAEANAYRPTFMHLDTILSVNPSLGTQFFAPMATLLGDLEARRRLAGYADRPWFGAFVAGAVKEADNPADLAALLVESRATLPLAQAMLLPRLLGRLVDAGDYAAARTLAVGFGGARPAMLGNFALTGATTDPRFAPLTWRLGDSDVVQTSVSPEGVMEVDLRPGSTEPVAERVTRLAPGSYLIEQKVTRSDDDGPLFVAWELRCQLGKRMQLAWRQPVPVPQGEAHYRARLEVPNDCPIQQWRLMALADDTQTDASFRIGALRLAKDGFASPHPKGAQ